MGCELQQKDAGSSKKVAQLVAVPACSFYSQKLQTFMAAARDIQTSDAEALRTNFVGRVCSMDAALVSGSEVLHGQPIRELCAAARAD